MDKRLILLIEDEEELVYMLKLRLEKNGYDVITAADGEEGLKALAARRPSLVMLDIMLPGMDGYQVCEAIKKDERYSDIPVVMLTAKAQERDRIKARQRGADAYIAKPFEPRELLATVEELIRR